MKYKVSVYEEMGGFAFIEAKNEKEAEAKAYAILEDEGIEGLVNKVNCFDTTHREIDVIDVIKDKD